MDRSQKTSPTSQKPANLDHSGDGPKLEADWRVELAAFALVVSVITAFSWNQQREPVVNWRKGLQVEAAPAPDCPAWMVGEADVDAEPTPGLESAPLVRWVQECQWREESLKRKVPAFLYAGTEDCGACKALEKGLQDPQVVEFINKNFVPVKLRPERFSAKPDPSLWFTPGTPWAFVATIDKGKKTKVWYSSAAGANAANLVDALKAAKKFAEENQNSEATRTSRSLTLAVRPDR